jgi:hypothetical protein
MEQLDAERDQNLIVPRALFMTDEQSYIHDIEKLELIYTNTEIIDTLKTTKERISNKVCEMVAHRYHIPIFRRYSN